MVSYKVHGDFRKTRKFLQKAQKMNIRSILARYGERGVNALAIATPKDSGKTADAWSYDVQMDRNGASVSWSNSNVNDGVSIAVILRYGHGTGTGGYVQGRDYISPAIRPIFDEIAESAWKEVVG